MWKLWIIAYREYVAMVGTKAFLFSLVMMPILMLGSLLLVPLLQRLSSGRELTIVVSDPDGAFLARLQASNAQRNADWSTSNSAGHEFDSPMQSVDRYAVLESDPPKLDDVSLREYNKKVREGTIYALMEIPEDFLSSRSPPSFYSNDAAISPARIWAMGVLNQWLFEERIAALGLTNLDPKELEQLRARVEIEPKKPRTNAETDAGSSAIGALQSMFLPFGVMMLMFMVILMAAQPMLESSMEEKSLRISEVLLGAVSPTQLMGGKLIGNVAGSLVIFTLYGAGGIYVLARQGMLGLLPMEMIPWFVLFQILGVLFFSSIFLVVGASVNELKEAQTLLLPVWMLLMLPLMVWIFAVRDPNGWLAISLSFFPPSAPLTMVLRLATGASIPFWQPVLAAGVMIASTAALVYFAGRIYRIGLLRTDGVRSIMQLFGRVLHRP